LKGESWDYGFGQRVELFGAAINLTVVVPFSVRQLNNSSVEKNDKNS